METRKWNVVAALAVVLCIVYVGVLAAAFFMRVITASEFAQYVLPIVTAVLGYLSHMLAADGGSGE